MFGRAASSRGRASYSPPSSPNVSRKSGHCILSPDGSKALNFVERVHQFDVHRSHAVLMSDSRMSRGATAAADTSHTNGYYKFGAELAHGSEGDVFAAVRVFPEGKYRQVALKRIRFTSNPKPRRHVVTELKVGQLVNAALWSKKNSLHEEHDKLVWEKGRPHPYIVHIIDWFPGLGGLEREIFLAMQRCDCGLDDLLCGVRERRALYERDIGRSVWRKNGTLVSPASYRFLENEIRKLFLQMLEALNFLNQLQIIHRDVKVENVLWARHSLNDVKCEKGGNYKLCDFGVAAVEIQSGARLQICSLPKSGTLSTMAPEVLRGQTADASSDVWSLACVLYEVIFLEKPFTARELCEFQNGDEALPRIVSFDNSFGEKPKIKRTRLRWIYSKALKKVLTAMFETNRTLRPTVRELKSEYSLLRDIVEVSPDYTVHIGEDELKTMVTADAYVKSLLTQLLESTGMMAAVEKQ